MTTTNTAAAVNARQIIEQLRSQGQSWNAIARYLNDASIPTVRGGARWWPATCQWAVGQTTRQTVPTIDRTGRAYLPHSRTFGVEVEWDGGRVTYAGVAAAITNAGVPAQVEGYTHAIPTGSWRVMQDGSCSGEAVSPVLATDSGLATTRTVMQAMRGAGCGARRRASVHVHVGVLDFNAADIARLVTNLKYADRALMAYVDDARLQGTWCPPMSDTDWNVLEQRATGARLLPRNGEGDSTTSGSRSNRFRDQGSGISRYRRYNFNPVLVYGTVEFRGHGATLNGKKIRPWIALTTALVEATKNGLVFDAPLNVKELTDALVASGSLTRRAATEFKAGVVSRSANPSTTRQHYIGLAAVAA